MPEIVIVTSPSNDKTQVIDVPELLPRIRHEGIRYERISTDDDGRA